MATKDYAVIRDGGRQFVVSVGDTIFVDNRKDPLPKVIEWDHLPLVRKGKQVTAGSKAVGKVLGEVAGRELGKKTISYVFKRRKGSHTKGGHRQKYIKVKIKEIKAGK